MNNLDSDIVQYIKNSSAAYHIEFYINQGFEVNKAIRRGWEEAYEELLEHSLREEEALTTAKKAATNLMLLLNDY